MARLLAELLLKLTQTIIDFWAPLQAVSNR